MRKRALSEKYKYGYILEKETYLFFSDLYIRIGIDSLFKGKSALDLGCGYGPSTLLLSEHAKSVTGIDINKYEEWKQFKNKKIKFIKANSSKLPFKDNTFDCVYLKDLLHHIKDIDMTFNEIKRVTKQGGSVVVLEGNRYNPVFFVYVTKIKGHDHFTQKEFEVLINKNFKNKKFIYLEAYPPFRFPLTFYKFIVIVEKFISNLSFFRPFFAYNVAIIKNVK